MQNSTRQSWWIKEHKDDIILHYLPVGTPQLSAIEVLEAGKARPADVRVVPFLQRHAPFHVQILSKVWTCTRTSRGQSEMKLIMDGRLGMHLRGSVFCADRGYDTDANCQMIFDMGMTPQIKQRKGATNRNKPYRRKAAKLFDTEVYKYGGLVEGIFGAEETKGHRLYCRYTKRVCQLRFGQVEAIGWNLKALNRIGCETMTKKRGEIMCSS